jgi:hypothetical protein
MAPLVDGAEAMQPARRWISSVVGWVERFAKPITFWFNIIQRGTLN